MKKPELLRDVNNGRIDHEILEELYENYLNDKILSSYTFPKEKSSDGFYHIYVKTEDGRRKQFKASTLEILKRKVIDFEEEKLRSKQKTFKECFDIIVSDKLARVKDPDKKYSVQNTVDKLISEYRRFFSDTEFENMLVCDITKRDIENIFEKNLSRYNLKKKGAASLKGILSAVFSYAYSEYLTEENAFLRCDFDKFKLMLIHDTPISKRAHSSDVIEDILYYARGYEVSNPSYIPAYALEMQILMGCRRGELPPLSWSDISDTSIWIHREQITVHRKPGEGHDTFVFVDRTKTDLDRYFPITDELNDFLLRLRRVHDIYYPDSTLLFPGQAQTGAITNNMVYKFYNKALKDLGIEKEAGITLGTHSFRRNAITNVINKSGGNIFLASKLYGNSPRTAEKNYFTGVDLDVAKKLLNG